MIERPRVASGVVAGVFGLLAIVRAVSKVTDQDSFWIAAAGRVAWATHSAPHENLFSFTNPTHPWVFHELFFGLVYAKGLAAFGPAFLNAFGIVAGTLTAALIAWHLARSGARPATFAVIMVAVLLELPMFHPRPPYASFSLVVAMTALAFGPRFEARHAAICVGLEWIWTQAHGSFPLGVVLLLLGALEHRDKKWRPLAAAGAALATLANPYGLKLHGLVAQYAAGRAGVADVIHHRIEEFLPAWAAPTAFGPFDGIAVLVTAAAGVFGIVKGARLRGAIVLIASGLAAYQVRHVHLATILAAMLLVPEIDRAVARDAPADATRGWRSVIPGAAAALVIAFIVARVRGEDGMLGPNVGGAALPALLARIPDGTKVHAPFGVSPPVIWYGYPRVRVLYDARNDCYDPDVAEDAIALEYDVEAQRKAADTIASRAADHAFARTTSEVFGSLSHSSAWTLVENRGDLALFRRNGAMGGP